LLSLWLLGAYDKTQKFFAASKGVLSGTLIILAIYALLPEDLRFSRAVIILGSAWSLLSIQGVRGLAGIINKNLFPVLRKKKRNAIVGSPNEAERILRILNNSGINYQYSGLISPNRTIADSSQIATIDQLEEFIRVNEIDEVIFCSSSISSQEIIRNMLILSEYGIEYKIAPPESISIIGSNSINALGDLYTPDYKAINTPASKRNKRLFDICSSLMLVITSPIWVLLVKNALSLFSNSFSVFIGKKTWVGYTSIDANLISGLPKIRKCVYPLSHPTHDNSSHSNDVNFIYAKNYRVGVDLSILWKKIIQ